VLLPTGGLPLVSVRLVFDAGTAQEPADTAGLATVAAGLLEAQDTQTTQSDVQAAINFFRSGAENDSEVTDDQTWFEARGVSIYVDLMVKGLERRVKAGNYSQDEIEGWRARAAAMLDRPAARRRTRFQRALYEQVFGADHPYAARGWITAETVKRIDRDETYAFKQKHFTAANGTLIVAGNFDPSLVKGYISETFGGWGRGHADQPVAAEAARRKQPAFVGLVAPEAPVVGVRIGYATSPGVDRMPERLVLETMLSMRVSAVREDLGASYGASATDHTHVGPGMLVIDSEVDAARAGEALATLRKAVRSLRDDEGFAEDFVTARRAVVEGLLADIDSSSRLTAHLAFLARHGKDGAWRDALVSKVATLTPDAVKEYAAGVLADEQEVLVCQGTRTQLERSFKAAGVTGMRWLD
jgi:zinc protease